jgi:hypothetical protein
MDTRLVVLARLQCVARTVARYVVLGAASPHPPAGASAPRHPAHVSITGHSSAPAFARDESAPAPCPPIDPPCPAWPAEPHRPLYYPRGRTDQSHPHRPSHSHPSDPHTQHACATPVPHTPVVVYIARHAPSPARTHPPHYPLPRPVSHPKHLPYCFSPFVPPVVFPMRAYQKELAADHLDRLLGKSILDRFVQQSRVAENGHTSGANEPQGCGEGRGPDTDGNTDNEQSCVELRCSEARET